MKYLITGICGHLGNNIARILSMRGDALSTRGLALEKEDASMLDAKIDLCRGDVTDTASLERFFDGADGETTVIHAAGLISISDKGSKMMERVNVGGTKNIIDMCKKYNVKRLVYISSVHALPVLPLGTPQSEVERFYPDKVSGTYAKTKAAASNLVLDSARDGLSAVIVHPSGIIGPNDYGRGFLAQLIENYVSGTVVACVRGGYDFVDVRDVAQGALLAAEKGRSGECYLLTNEYYSALSLLDMVSDLTGVKRIRTVIPLGFVMAMAPLAELYFKARHERPLFTRESMAILDSNAYFINDKARRELGYRPRRMNETMRDTVFFLKETGKLHRRVKGKAVVV